MFKQKKNQKCGVIEDIQTKEYIFDQKWHDLKLNSWCV